MKITHQKRIMLSIILCISCVFIALSGCATPTAPPAGAPAESINESDPYDETETDTLPEEETEEPLPEPVAIDPSAIIYEESEKEKIAYVWGIEAATGNHLEIPAQSPSGYSVTGIGNGAFMNNTDLVYVTLPDTVKRIDSSAFSGCKSLRTIRLPSGLESISEFAFAGCVSLREADLPNSLLDLGSSAFSGCENLREANLPNGLVHLGAGAFNNCSSLISVEIPNTLAKANSKRVVNLPSSIFRNCYSLETVTLPENLQSIGEACFFACTSLKKLVITAPSGINLRIEKSAFAFCTSLTEVVLPTRFSLEAYVFRSCASLKHLELKGGYVDAVVAGNLRDAAFINCFALEELTVNCTKGEWERIRSEMGEAFAARLSTVHCTDGDVTQTPIKETPSLELQPNGDGTWMVKGIGTYASLHVVIPAEAPDGNPITIINDHFLKTDEAREITIPKSIIEIGDNAFYRADLKAIYYEGTMEEWKTITLGENLTLYKVTVYCTDGELQLSAYLG